MAVVVFFVFLKNNNRTTYGLVSGDGVLDRYWSSTLSGSDAKDLTFGNNAANMYDGYRADGVSVRCIKDY